MAQEVYMDVPQVEKMAAGFGTFGQVLKEVARGLETAIFILKVTSFVGMIGNWAVASFLEKIKPRVEKMSEKMFELQGDIKGAIDHYTTGDVTGSNRFR